jgi:hypothetical protein
LEDEPDNGCVSLKTATVEPFKSKAGDNTFGTAPKASEPEKGGVSSASAAKQSGSIGETERAGSIDGSGNADNSNNSGGSRHQETSTERQSRRSRMLAYVSTGIDQSDSTKNSGEVGISDLIDVAAIAAVLKYEQTRGWSPEEQPHNNPGFDIVSQSADGIVRRLIEVKGLDGDWTERGIKLSNVQYGMAERYPDQYWIYVVENARNLDRQRVSAIANPFSKVQEYWFDENWRQVAEEKATAQDVNIKIGARVHHATWGIGTIVAMKRHGLAPPFLTVDFGSIEGRRGIPYSSSLKFVN